MTLKHQPELSLTWRTVLLFTFTFGSAALIWALPPIPQDLAYHQFADTRSWLGLPNTLDVVSNLAFLVAGGLGLQTLLAGKDRLFSTSWLVVFTSIVLIGPGSAWYHWSPDSKTLIWDRLPMTLVFMSLFSTIIGEFFGKRIGQVTLIPGLILGLSSVIYWALTDDLRLYAWVQFMPLGFAALLLILYRNQYHHERLLLITLFWYLLAKVFEHFDAEIFSLTFNMVSGHTLKHLAAAAACFTLCLIYQASADSAAEK